MKVLIKLGGTLLDNPAKRASMAEQLARAAKQCDLAVVHGGGKQVTQYLEERGIESRFVNGLRVSDQTVVDAVTKVIAGGVNKQLVASLLAAGCGAVGISGIDGGLVTARQVSKELQFTGTPVAADGRLLDLLLSAGYLPVIACVAGDPQGTIYNVNADQLAVSCAVGWGAAKLFFLTDVPGVKGEDGAIIPSLTPADVANLVSTGVAHGGMQAKLESCVCALESGVPHVVIASGQTGEICRDLIAGELRGTSITLQEAGVA